MPLSKIIDLVIGVGVLALVLFLGRGLIDGVQAPAKLDAALGQNEALKDGAQKQNEAVNALKTAADKKKAASSKAVAAAGKVEEARAKAILAAPCSWGRDDYECANGRVNRELGLK